MRRAKGLTLADLADEIDCSIVHMSDIERGRKNPPGTKKISKLLVKMGQEDVLQKMLHLAVRSRRWIEISVEDKNEEVADMLAALARSCDEGKLDNEMARKISQVIQEREERAE